MKVKTLFILFLLTVTASLIAGQSILDYLRAEPNGNSITVKWKSNNESDIQYFAVERSGADQKFEELDRENAKGYPTSYQYVDETAFKLGDKDKVLSNKIYFYRISIYKKDNSRIYSDIASATPEISVTRRTWGMLKEMFR